MINRRVLLAAALLLLPVLGCAAPKPSQQEPPPENDRAEQGLAEIERRTGGRLGVALVGADGRTLLARRSDERFAMCSTFKLPLAAMVLAGAGQGSWRLADRLPLSQADILSHSPLSEPRVAAGYMPLEDAAAAIVTHSDNAAANLVLRRIGGSAALTSWLRGQGDGDTRLDRFELELNENSVGDPRDTTTPSAMAKTANRILVGTGLPQESRTLLRRWTVASQSGLRRVRAGLPQDWEAGDKTGSCGSAWNDVAWFRAPSGREYSLAVYLDRPTVQGPEAEAAIADVARVATQLVD